MKSAGERSLYRARSLDDAVAALADHEPVAEVLAGATWIMRADLREEFGDRYYISIGGLADLRKIDITTEAISIGGCATHAELARGLHGIPGMNALADAAAKSANPAVRNVATIGGNICTIDFAAADLVPALLCLGAIVEYRHIRGTERIDLTEFLAKRESLRKTAIVTRIIVLRTERLSAHVRLPLRKAGDYPVAIVSMSVAMGKGTAIDEAIIAVGSVETTARRWTRLESAIRGQTLDLETITSLAKASIGEFSGRDGVDAPGWYRTQVLPTLVRRAFEDLHFHDGGLDVAASQRQR